MSVRTKGALKQAGEAFNPPNRDHQNIPNRFVIFARVVFASMRRNRIVVQSFVAKSVIAYYDLFVAQPSARICGALQTALTPVFGAWEWSMELRHLRYFVAVAEELHFGRAAARVRTAQSSFSAQIRDLEQEIGVQLLRRTKRQVQLTDAGRAFLVQVRATLKQAEQAVRAAKRADQGNSGTLVIGFVPSADCISFPEILKAFRQQYPEVQIDLRNLVASEQVDALHKGELDIGFMRPLRNDRAITSERILREPVEVVLPNKHRLLGKSELSLEDVAGEDLILCSRIHAPLQHDVIIAQFRAANLVPKVSLETDHIQTVLGLVAAGIGISLLPASVENLRAPGLSYRPLKKPAPHMDMAVAYRRGDPSRTLANFLALVRELSRTGFKTRRTGFHSGKVPRRLKAPRTTPTGADGTEGHARDRQA